MIVFSNLLRDFDKPHVLDSFTEEQIDMIGQMKKELYELAKMFGYYS